MDKSSPRDWFCDACMKAKHHVTPFPKESLTLYDRVGDLIVTDVWGPAQVESLQKNKYFVSFTDMHSHFSVIDFIKSTSEVFEKYKAYKAFLENQTGRRIKRV